MGAYFLKLSDILDFKKVHWRHIVQSMAVFSVFCTLDTVGISEVVWLISAGMAVIAIVVVMLVAERVRLSSWTNALNVAAAGFCVGCYFLEIFFPIAILFVTLTAGVRIVYVRQRLNDYCLLIFLIASVFVGIIARFALILLPTWCLSLLMLATVANPTLAKKSTEPLEPPATSQNKTLITLASVLLTVFFLCIEVFGGPLTDEIAHGFPMQLVNLAYLLGYILFIAAVLALRIKIPSILVMMLSVVGLFFFLIPPLSTFGIYFLLFLGGGIKVLMLALPITIIKKHKQIGALSGLFIYRLGFLLSGATKAIVGEGWSVDGALTYSLAAVNIIMGVSLIFLLARWDRHEVKIATEERVRALYDAPKPLPAKLSQREKEIAQLVLEGCSVEEIGKLLFIAASTVRVHIKSILKKTECTSQRMFIVKFGKV